MIEIQTDLCIYEVKFRYNAKTEGSTNSNSDIAKLGDIASKGKSGT